MRIVVLAVLGGVAWTAAPRHAAAAATPQELLRSCNAVIAGARAGKADVLEIPRAGLDCWYYLSAVQNMSVLVDQHGRRLLGICAPANETLLNDVRIFVRYAQRHPGTGRGNAAAVAVEALNTAFPCGSGGTS